jgi:hypothetical protein
MNTKHAVKCAAVAVTLALVNGGVLSADKYAAKVPDGLALSEFKGYETWEVVSASHTAGGEGMGGDETFNIIVANPAMIKAYAAGVPGNGKPFPDGAKAVKIQYSVRRSPEAPFNVSLPDRFKDLAVMAKDAKRFQDGGGWGYGLFDYDAASAGFKPNGTGAKCGVACHTIVKSKDYVFTRYEKK